MEFTSKTYKDYSYQLDKAALLLLYPSYDTVYTGIFSTNEKRFLVCLYKKNGNKRTSISLARALMQVKLGRRLVGDEEVDHIDDDPTNDKFENLQIITSVKNKNKTTRAECNPICVCPECGKEFKTKLSVLIAAQKRKAEAPCCGKSCAGVRAIKTRNATKAASRFIFTVK